MVGSRREGAVVVGGAERSVVVSVVVAAGVLLAAAAASVAATKHWEMALSTAALTLGAIVCALRDLSVSVYHTGTPMLHSQHVV